MAFLAVSQNYTGRQVDLALFPALAASGQAVLSGFGTDLRAVAGPAKAAQNYLRLLFTPLGSVRSRPGLGTRLLPRLKGGYVRTPADLTGLFAVENLRALTYLATLPARPADETIATATLTGATVERTGVTLAIGVTLQSGDSLPLLLPVAWRTS